MKVKVYATLLALWGLAGCGSATLSGAGGAGGQTAGGAGHPGAGAAGTGQGGAGGHSTGGAGVAGAPGAGGSSTGGSAAGTGGSTTATGGSGGAAGAAGSGGSGASVGGNSGSAGSGGSGGTCSAGLTSCSGVCVDLQSDPNNCGGCGSNGCANNSLGCSAGQCVCTANTPNGLEICFRPGQVRGTCWGGVCVLPAYFPGCNSAADCVPGGCTGPGGYCLGTVDVAGEVSCTDSDGAYVVCPTSQGCTDVISEPPVFCGDGNGGRGAITCDGPSDCPSNSDCCYNPGAGRNCAVQTQPGVIGSGCPSTGPGSQLPNACDPLNPTANCPAGKSCVSDFEGTEVRFTCE